MSDKGREVGRPGDVGPVGQADHLFVACAVRLRNAARCKWAGLVEHDGCHFEVDRRPCGLPESAHPASKSQLKRLEAQGAEPFDNTCDYTDADGYYCGKRAGHQSEHRTYPPKPTPPTPAGKAPDHPFRPRCCDASFEAHDHGLIEAHMQHIAEGVRADCGYCAPTPTGEGAQVTITAKDMACPCCTPIAGDLDCMCECHEAPVPLEADGGKARYPHCVTCKKVLEDCGCDGFQGTTTPPSKSVEREDCPCGHMEIAHKANLCIGVTEGMECECPRYAAPAPPAQAEVEPTHSPEPWLAFRMVDEHGVPLRGEKAAQYVADCIAANPEGDFYAISCTKADGKDYDVCHTGNGPDSKINAARIVDCVRACQGVANPQAGELGELRQWRRDAAPPAATASGEVDYSTSEKAAAWEQVFDALNESVPGFIDLAPTGIGCALVAISRLAASERALQAAIAVARTYCTSVDPSVSLHDSIMQIGAQGEASERALADALVVLKALGVRSGGPGIFVRGYGLANVDQGVLDSFARLKGGGRA